MTTRRYLLQATNTFAAVIVRNDDSKLLSRLGHDHVVRAREFTSTIALDVDQLEQMRFAFSFAVDAMAVDEPNDRVRVDLDPDVSSRDRKQTRDNMLGRGQLDAKRHGNIDFRVDGARPGDDGKWLLMASLTIRQKRFEFDFPVDIQIKPHLRVRGEVELTHGDLGLKPYRAPMGTLKNKEELTFVVDVDAAPL